MKLVCLTAAALLGCAALGHAQTGCSLATGSLANGSYRNDQLGLIYQYPIELSPSEPAQLPHDPMSRFAVVAAFWKTPRDLDEPDVFISADDPTQYSDSTAFAYMHRIENTVTTRYKARILQSGRIYQLSGQPFYRLDYQLSDAAAPLYKTALTGRLGGCEVTFQLTARSREDVDHLFRSVAASTVQARP